MGLNKYDLASILVIGVIFALILANWNNLPTAIDWLYHGAIAREMIDKNEVYLDYNSYQFAPEGRPHLYPPGMAWLYAILMVLSSKLFALRLLTLFFYPAFLLGSWLLTRDWWGKKIGLIVLLGIISLTDLFSWVLQPIPSSFIFILLPLILYFNEKDKNLISFILLVLGWWMYPTLTLGISLSLIFYNLFNKKNIKHILVSPILFAPWLLKIKPDIDMLSIPLTPIRSIMLNIPIVVIGCIALVYLVFKSKIKILNSRYVPIIFLILFSIVLCNYSLRHLNYIYLYLVLLTGAALGLLKNQKVAWIVFTVSLLLALFGHYKIILGNNSIPVFHNNPPVKFLLDPHFRNIPGGIWEELSWIDENTLKNSVIDVDEIDVACSITTFTGRRTTYGMFYQVLPERTNTKLNKNLVTITKKDLNVTLIKERDIWKIYAGVD